MHALATASDNGTYLVECFAIVSQSSGVFATLAPRDELQLPLSRFHGGERYHT